MNLSSKSIDAYRSVTGYSRKTVDAKLLKLFGATGERPELSEFVKAVIADLTETAAGRNKPELEDGELNPEQEKARADKERADKLALDNMERRGELVRADDVEQEWVKVLMAVRAGFLALPSNVAEEIAVLKSARQVKQRLTDEVSEILEELSNVSDGEDDIE